MSELAPAVVPNNLPQGPSNEVAFFLPKDLETPRFLYLRDDTELGIKRDPIHNRMSGHPFYGKRIQLRSTYGKTAQPVHIEPTHARRQDTAWLGIPRLTPADKEIMDSHGFALAIPGETFIDVPDGHDVDCGTEQGLYLWEWLQYAPQIITDTDTYNPEKPHEGADKELYVLIPADEEQRRVQTFVDRKRASDWLFACSPRQWYDIARLIGSGMDQGNQTDVFNYLMGIAELAPKRILDVKEDNQAEQKLLVKRLLDAGIIQESEGMFRYNSSPLGTTEAQVVDYIMMERNLAIVTYMKNQLISQAANGPIQPKAQYATYKDETSEAVLNAARAGSSTLGFTMPTAPANTASTNGTTAPAQPASPLTPPTPLRTDGAELTMEDLGLDDDYMPEEQLDANVANTEAKAAAASTAKNTSKTPKP